MRVRRTFSAAAAAFVLAVGLLGIPAGAELAARAGGLTIAGPNGMRIQVAPHSRPDAVTRSMAAGVESVARFAERPEAEELVYDVALTGVSAVRHVGNTVEFLGGDGAPRLRMAPPLLVGAREQLIEPTVDVQGCAVDRDGHAPWGRKVASPGADSCRVELRWTAAPEAYPMTVDSSWTTTSDMVVPVYDHSATRLNNGRIVVIGGVETTSGAPVSSNATQIYDPESNTWAAMAPIPGEEQAGARDQHTATKLSNDDIIVAGGFHRVREHPATPLSTVFRFVPYRGLWQSEPRLAVARGGHTADWVPLWRDGRRVETVVAAGGSGSSGPLATAERYDGQNVRWDTSRLTRARDGHAATAFMDGHLLLTGGATTPTGSATNATELYDPGTNTWSAGPPMNQARRDHAAALMLGGKVIALGGRDRTGAPTASVEVYDPDASTWSTRAPLRTARHNQMATVQPTGQVVVAGGVRAQPLRSVEAYEPITDSWTRLPGLRVARSSATLSSLPGALIAMGGVASDAMAVASTERFQPEDPYRTSWIGETELPEDSAAYPEAIAQSDSHKWRFVQARVTALWVDEVDGAVAVYANNPYDEGFRSTGVYRYEQRDGGGIFRPITRLGGCASPGEPPPRCGNLAAWGGFAVTGDDTYVYVSYAARDRACVRRYAKAAVHEDELPPSTRWDATEGGDDAGDLCLPEPATVNEPFNTAIRGLAASSQHLFVSSRADNTIRVYDKRNVAAPVSVIQAPDPRGLVFSPNPAPGGSLWAIVNGAAPTGPQPPYVQEYRIVAGALIPGRAISGADLVPTSLAMHPSGLLAVTDDHEASQQVRFFDPAEPGAPELVAKRLGEPGGVVRAGGEYGPTRLDGPSAVGFDHAGNAYVAGVGVHQDTSSVMTDLRRFSPSGTPDGQTMSYPGQEIVTPDPARPNVVYSPTHEYTLNLDSKVPPGQEWSPQRTTRTVDRFSCHDDGRIAGIDKTPIGIRYLGTPPRKYLYMAGSVVSVYRFDETGSIARPAFVYGRDAAPKWPGTQGSKPQWSWRDKDGDCRFDSDEFTGEKQYFSGHWTVADNGDLWVVAPGSPIRRVPLQSVDAQHNPVYDFESPEVLPLPAPFRDGGAIWRIAYVSSTDTLYVVGRDRTTGPPANGWKLARYDNYHRDHATAKPTWIVDFPDEGDRCHTDDPKFGWCWNLFVPTNITVAGDRMYVATIAGEPLGANGLVRAYDTETGALRTVLVPGREVAFRSGWLDIPPYSIAATQLPDGRRFLFTEELTSSRILLYRGF